MPLSWLNCGEWRVAKWTCETTDEEIEAALERARNEPAPPSILEAQYQRDLELFILKISDGRRLVLPRENLQWVAGATQEQAAEFNLGPPGGPMGSRIWWPQLDEGHPLDALLEGRTGSEKWMAKIHKQDVAA
jgi:hypothetical protein